MMVAVAAKSAIVVASGWFTIATAAGEANGFYSLVLLTLLVATAIVYVVGQIKDFRPNRRLREENIELRSDCDDLRQRLDEAGNELVLLRKSRDFEGAFSRALEAITMAGDQARERQSQIMDYLGEMRTKEVDAINALVSEIREDRAERP